MADAVGVISRLDSVRQEALTASSTNCGSRIWNRMDPSMRVGTPRATVTPLREHRRCLLDS